MKLLMFRNGWPKVITILFVLSVLCCMQTLGIELNIPSEYKNVNFYEVLGTSQHASFQELKKKYRKMSVQVHPDKHPKHEKEQWEEAQKKVNFAYQLLSDPQKRREYDSQLAAQARMSSFKAKTPMPQGPRTIKTRKPPAAEPSAESFGNFAAKWEECLKKCQAGTCKKENEFVVACICYDYTRVRGIWCDQELYACLKHSNCEHNGRCLKVDGQRRCVCKDRFSGPFCRERVSCFQVIQDKKVDKCQKGGKCRVIKSAPHEITKCLCKKSRSGRFCERQEFTSHCEHGDEVPLTPDAGGRDSSRWNANLACDCHSGWTGVSCNKKCPRHYYGKDCLFGCVGRFFCKNSKPCDPETGKCPVSERMPQCDPGWKGAFCNISDQDFVGVTYEMKGAFLEFLEDEETIFYQYERNAQKKFVLQEYLAEHFNARFRRHTNITSGGKNGIITKTSRWHRNAISNKDFYQMGLNELEKLASSIGFIIRSVTFARGSVKVNFQVAYPRDAEDAASLQETVTNIIKNNAHKYNSTLGEGYQIKQNSVKVKKVKVKSSVERRNSKSSRLIQISGAVVLLGLASLTVIGLVINCKTSPGKKKTSPGKKKTSPGKKKRKSSPIFDAVNPLFSNRQN